jgi:hypothetical protein
MREPDFFLTVGDRQPVIQATLLDPNANPIDLNGATVAFSMATANGATEGLGGPAAIIGDPTKAVVQYAWDAGDTLTQGDYDAEWIVTFSDGRQMTFPNDRSLRIRIRNRV